LAVEIERAAEFAVLAELAELGNNSGHGRE